MVTKKNKTGLVKKVFKYGKQLEDKVGNPEAITKVAMGIGASIPYVVSSIYTRSKNPIVTWGRMKTLKNSEFLYRENNDLGNNLNYSPVFLTKVTFQNSSNHSITYKNLRAIDNNTGEQLYIFDKNFYKYNPAAGGHFEAGGMKIKLPEGAVGIIPPQQETEIHLAMMLTPPEDYGSLLGDIRNLPNSIKISFETESPFGKKFNHTFKVW